MKSEELGDLAKKVAIILEQFETAARNINQVTIDNTEQLALTVKHTESQTKMLVEQSNGQIRQATKVAVKEGLNEGVVDVVKNLSIMTERLSGTLKHIEGAYQKNNRQKLILGLMTMITVIGCSAAIGFATWMIWNAQQEVERITYRKEVLDAVSAVDFALCGKLACVRLDEQAKKWGKKGEFVIVQ
ncbi:hypothetical protein [Neisseria sp. Ec49-e6-T10]|uniref:hypothetical protein n=1 Tax=Neisseria sp. Ec49-e6-T10 TaxID=3140744 RepID=UPI003EB89006